MYLFFCAHNVIDIKILRVHIRNQDNVSFVELVNLFPGHTQFPSLILQRHFILEHCNLCTFAVVAATSTLLLNLLFGFGLVTLAVIDLPALTFNQPLPADNLMGVGSLTWISLSPFLSFILMGVNRASPKPRKPVPEV
jgi:hypothetical protein